MADLSSYSKVVGTSIASATYTDATTTGTSFNLHTQQLPVQGGALGLTNGVTALCALTTASAGTSIVFTLQGSRDDSTWFDLAASSAQTAASNVAVGFAAPVPQYVRVKAVNGDGTSPSAVFSAVLIAGGR